MQPQKTMMNLTSFKNNTNETLGNKMAESMILGFNVPNVVICFLALVLNIAEAALIVTKRQFKPFQRILLSLSCADILVALLYVIQKFYEKDHGRKIYDSAIEHLISQPLELFAVMSSITNIILLGVDRLIAVRYPLKHRLWMTKTRINLYIVAAWFGSIALSVLSNVNRFAEPDNKTPQAQITANRIFSGLLFSSGFVITVIYVLIIARVVRQRKIASQMRKSGAEDRSNETTVTITCVLVVVAFSLCSYPFAIAMLIHNKGPNLPFKTILLNALLDPLVYFFMGYVKRKLKKTKHKEQLEMQSRGPNVSRTQKK